MISGKRLFLALVKKCNQPLLQDDDMEHHKNHNFDLIDEPIIEHDSQSNDDLLHSALNSIHNQT